MTQLELLNRQNVFLTSGEITKPVNDFQVANRGVESLITNHSKTIENALSHIFPEKQEETRIQKARLIMGDDVKDLSDEDLDVYLTNFQYLIDSWLDEYEKQVFDNKTLKEKLKEG